MLSITYNRPFLYPYQKQIIDCEARFTVTEASTKVGKTASHLVWLHEQSLTGKKGNNYWWVAPTRSQSKMVFDRLRNQLETTAAYQFNLSNLTVTTPIGTIIWFKTAEKPDNLYGDDVYAFVFDEFTRGREEAWFALRSTITKTNAKGKFIGNVRGKGWGFKLAQRAKDVLNTEWKHFKLTAYDAVKVGLLSAKEIEDAKNELPEHVFNELYLAIPSDSGLNPFGLDAIRKCVKPISTKPATCYGIDLAKSTDFTVIIGLDDDSNICYFDRFQIDWAGTKTKIMALPLSVEKNIDSTGVGDPIVEDVQREGSHAYGFKYTSTTKQQLMTGLQTAIQLGEIGIIEGVVQEELESFEYEHTRTGIKYSAPSGLHDDCVNALALARNIWRKRGTGEYHIM